MKRLVSILTQLVFVSFLVQGCSILKSKADRCFDVIDEYGHVNLVIKDHKKQVFSCEDRNYEGDEE
jgi:hypothetical protein